MACERWWFNRGCSFRRWSLLVATLALVLGSSLVIAESDLSYYRYNEVSRVRRSVDGPLYFSLDTEALPRERRDVKDENPGTTGLVLTVSSVNVSVTPTGNATPNEGVPAHGAVVPSGQLPGLSGKPNAPSGAEKSEDDKVTYSTANATVTVPAASNATTEEPRMTKTPKVVISLPINPDSGVSTGGVHVWANETKWDNVTDQSVSRAKAAEAQSTTELSVDDISISKFSDVTNQTLTERNITKTEEDTHQYYNSTFTVGEANAKKFWVDLDNHPKLEINELLSESHRRAATVKLSFDFPFYGHKVRNITIATGGFLYTGEYVHSWLAATQYIAPLMANFDTRLSKDSFVKYADNGTSFTVEWEKVVLQDNPKSGAFTFQATLHQNGDIVFVYSAVPLVVENIEDTAHPVKVGLSDAYIMDRTVFFVRRKTIYEYHRVNFNRQDIKNWTVIYLRALPTCLDMDTCSDCLTKTTGFDCKWCPSLNRCSTGTSRERQEWLMKGCERSNNNIQNLHECPATSTTTYTDHIPLNNHDGYVPDDEELSASVEPSQQAKGLGPLENTARDHMNMSVSGVIGILLVVSLVAGLAAWAAYAYRNPHSASGQMLIRYRPSQWSWRRGEARYTAATIHM